MRTRAILLISLIALGAVTVLPKQVGGQVPLYVAFAVHFHQPVYYPGMQLDREYFDMPTDPGSSETVRHVFEDCGFCYIRPAQLVNRYPEAKITVHLTGSLIWQLDWLAKENFQSKSTSLGNIWDEYRRAIRTGRMEIVIDGFYHPIFPLIEQRDAEFQFAKAISWVRQYFGVEPSGFFPPELAFSENIIPWLKSFGIRWVFFDSFHIGGLPNRNKWTREYCEAAFRPHLAEHAGAVIIVVPREHWLGQNQADGFDANYLVQELRKIQQWNTDPQRPFLVVILSDGENGWMRQAGGGYYDWFWPAFLEAIKNEGWIRLTTVSEYLREVYTPKDLIEIETGSWGVGGARTDLSQWAGSQLDVQMWERVSQVRENLKRMEAGISGSLAESYMRRAWGYFAMALTSCYWFWDSPNWAQKCYTALDLALQAAENATRSIGMEGEVTSELGLFERFSWSGPSITPEPELSVSGSSAWSLACTFTNKKNTFLWVSTTGEPISQFSGLTVAGKRVVESWEVSAGGQRITPAVCEFTYTPWGLARSVGDWMEETFMPDNLSTFLLRYTGGSGQTLTFTLFLDISYGDEERFENGALILRSLAQDRENVAYVAITCSGPAIYQAAGRGRVTHEYPFDEMRIENSQRIFWDVHRSGSLIVENVQDIVFAVAVGRSQSEAVRLSSQALAGYSGLVDAKRSRITSLVQSCGIQTSDPELTKALRLAVACADSLIVDEDFGKTIWAGLPWFNQGWGRDTFISLSGFALVTGRLQEAKEIIRSFAGFQRESDGRIPNRIGDWRTYTSSDATLWFAIRIYEYFLNSSDRDFLAEIFPAVERAIEGTWRSYVDLADGMVRSEALATWMDTSRDPREGKPVEIQALWIRTLEDAARMAEVLGRNQTAIRWKQMAENARRSFRIFWNPAAGYLYDYVDSGGRKVARIRPNVLMALSVVPEILPAENVRLALRTALNSGLVAPHGVRSLIPSDPLYVGIDNSTWDPPAYHNGDVWPWLSGPAIDVMVSCGEISEASRLFRLFAAQTLGQANIGAVHEISDGDRDKPKGCWTQAWSVAEFIRTYYRSFLGIRPGESRTIVSPRQLENVQSISGTTFSRGKRISVIYSWEKDLQRVELLASGESFLVEFAVPAGLRRVLVSSNGENRILAIENGIVRVELTVDGRGEVTVYHTEAENIVPAADFSVRVEPSTVKVRAGRTATVSVIVENIGSYENLVSLTVSAPSGVFAVLGRETGVPPFTADLTVSGTVPGIYTVVVRATSGGVVRSGRLTVDILTENGRAALSISEVERMIAGRVLRVSCRVSGPAENVLVIWWTNKGSSGQTPMVSEGELWTAELGPFDAPVKISFVVRAMGGEMETREPAEGSYLIEMAGEEGEPGMPSYVWAAVALIALIAIVLKFVLG
jgi:glycogen debranching enzyme